MDHDVVQEPVRRAGARGSTVGGGSSSGRVAPGGSPDLGAVRNQLAAAEALLADPEAPLDEEERKQLAAAVEQARQKLGAYEALAAQGGDRTTAMGGIAVGATAVVADDATGIGVADDWLLVILGLAALYTLATTRPPASSIELEQGWTELAGALRTVAQLGTGLVVLKLNGEKIRGNAEQLAAHLARLLGLAAVGGVSSGEPPGNGQDDDHWWTEIKAFLKNIRDAYKDASRKQVMRELLKRFTQEQVDDIVRALEEAAKKMGEPPPPFLP